VLPRLTTEDGLIDLWSVEHRSFLERKLEAEWLFGDDVREYLELINATVRELRAKAMDRDKVIEASGDVSQLIQETTGIEREAACYFR
jgi:hypothetical protein